MQDLNNFVTGDNLTAAEFIEIPSEIQNAIESLGITLSAGDLNQLGKAIAGYVANGNFYTDSGAADAYVLTQIGSKQAPTALTDGMRVVFRPSNTNTGASTVNVASLGATSIKTAAGTDPPAGDLPTGDLVTLVYDNANGWFEWTSAARRATWTSAELVGSGLAVAGVGVPALTALNGTDVAFIDNGSGGLRTYRWNGSTWSLVGSGLAVATVGNPALTALNGTDVAFIDSTNDELRTYRWNGSAWALVGSGLAVAGAGGPALTALNGTDVAFIDSTNDELRTYRWNGSAWALVGSGLVVATVGNPALAALNGTDVAFIDDTNDTLRKYRFGFYIGDGPYRP